MFIKKINLNFRTFTLSNYSYTLPSCWNLKEKILKFNREFSLLNVLALHSNWSKHNATKSHNPWDNYFFFKKKNSMALFMDRDAEQLRWDCLLFTNNSTVIPGTHLIDLRRTKDLVDLRAIVLTLNC